MPISRPQSPGKSTSRARSLVKANSPEIGYLNERKNLTKSD